MPCESGPSLEDERREREERDRDARVMCEMSRVLTPEQFDALSPEARMWITEHRKWDEQRRAEEEQSAARAEAKKRALAKLTVNERALLGI